MKIAVLSDIHGNHIAFEKCVKYIEEQKIEKIIFLGDYIGEMPYPQITMKLLHELRQRKDCRFIKGNKEDYWINYRKNGEKGWTDFNSTTGSLFYSYRHLTKKDIDFFETLKEKDTVLFSGMPDIEICHIPSYKYTLEEVKARSKKSGKIERKLLLCGHRHIQGQIEFENQTIINPGAVGVPLYSNGETQFAILHYANERWHVEYISLCYDVEKVIQEMYEEELDKHAPYWTKISIDLLRGKNESHAAFLKLAMEICKQQYDKCIWPDIPEECFEAAFLQYVRI